MTTTPHHLVIVGGGFAGLWAARALAGSALRITLIDRRNHHLFQPLLYQVATAALSAPDIAAPLRHILRGQPNVQVLLHEVSEVLPQQQQLRLADGRLLAYDTLLLAAGATHAYFGNDAWSEHAPGLKTLDDAVSLRRKLLLAFERAEAEPDPALRQQWLSFAIVGAGPTGVELAGALASIARLTLRNEFRHIDPATAQVRLIEAGPRVLGSFPPELSHKARRQLERLGVQVITGKPVTHIDAEGLLLDGQHMPARTVIWAAGVAASPLAATLGAPLDRAGRVQVNNDLTVPGHPEIFVAGDLAALARANGHPVPGVAPAAKQMGQYVAKVIRARLRGTAAPAPFQYADHGNLATIGRMAAIADLGRVRLSGAPAWWFWLAAHVFFLIGFRNRLAVLLNWGVSWWTHQRSARIIFGDADTPAAAPDQEHRH